MERACLAPDSRRSRRAVALVVAFIVCIAFTAAFTAQAQAPAPVSAAPTLIVPDAADLRIKTRRTMDIPGASVTTEIVALKGARQRRESIIDLPPRPGAPSRRHPYILIAQCDERRLLMLNPEAKIYAYEPIIDPSAELARIREAAARQKATPPPPPQPPPPDMATRPVVTITMDSVETGERRTYGSYTARHIINTRKTEPGPGAHAMASVDETDGWYVDLPEIDCRDPNGPIAVTGTALTIASLTNDRIEYKTRGTARRGYAIEETDRMGSAGNTKPFVAHIELMEISEAPLDPVLFTVPEHYRPALPYPYGGHDMSRPDTVLNRLELYGRMIDGWANQLLARWRD